MRSALLLLLALTPWTFAEEKLHFFEQPDAVLYRLSEQKWDRRLHRALGLPETIELALTHRSRLESVSHPWRRGQAPDTDTQVVQRTRLRLGVEQGPAWLLFEGQDARLLGHDPGEFFGNTVEDHFDVQQLFVSRKFDVGELRADVHAGRFTFEYGGTRTIGRNVLPNATNAFDGIHVNLAREKRWRGRAFFTRPVERLVDDANESSPDRIFWGFIGEESGNPYRLLDLAYLHLDDDLARADFATYTARVRREKNPGLPDYELDTAYQDGDKAGKAFEAAMVHAELGYTFARRWRPRLSAYLDYASGTRDPAGPRNTTFDRLFGLRDFDLGATANYGPFSRSNLVSATFKAEVRPRTGTRLFFKHAWRRLDEPRDALAGSSLPGFPALRDPTGRAGDDLGHDIELALVRQMGTNTFIDVRWAHWWKGSWFDRLPAAAGLPAGGAEDTDFFLVSTEARF